MHVIRSPKRIFMTSNVHDKIDFSQREVGGDSANAELMVQKQKNCKLDAKSIGAVPFLFTAEKCYLGQDEIINFFKTKANVQ